MRARFFLAIALAFAGFGMLTSPKSAEAKANNDPLACGLPYSFSNTDGFSAVTDRIAALAFSISRLASNRSVEGRDAGKGTLSAAR